MHVLLEKWINEVKLSQLRQQIKVGTEQLDQGQGIKIETKTHLDALFNEIKS